MGSSLSKTPEQELRRFFLREIKGQDACTFSGSLRTYDHQVLKNFEQWLIDSKYTFQSSEDYVEGTFKYTINKNK